MLHLSGGFFSSLLDLVRSCPDGVILWQVACEFVAAARKLAPQGFTSQEAWNRLADFVAIFPLVLPAAGVLERAQRLQVDSILSFWDALIVAACRDTGIGILYSEDLPGRAIPSLQIVNPFE